MPVDGAPARRIGASEDLPERVAVALRACAEATGRPPTARAYDRWRKSLSPEERWIAPSLTSVVPIAYPSWDDARAAAGMGGGGSLGRHGPSPRWTAEECLASLREWLDGGGGGALSAYSLWAADRGMPSASTVRLRLRMPWSDIVAEARAGDGPGPG